MNQSDEVYGAHGGTFGTVNSGHRNPLMPGVSGKNTRAEKSGGVMPRGYRVDLEQSYLEELAKATYVKEMTVYDYFLGHAQRGQSEPVLHESDFARAVQSLDLDWTLRSTNSVFTAIDLAANQSSKLQLTPAQIDEAVAFGC